ncbi:MAG: DNA alkylation repair protein [Muribaculaceae bacterium]|nr:DNA alkylation repair protein [Muribaculaceae bacterium]
MEKEEGFNEMQTVKRRMYAMRNGVIADALRKGGSPFRVIFGLNLPQLVEIAESIGKDADMARQLWTNTATRESMLLAPMLMPVEEMGIEEAAEWGRQVPAPEVADILCHRLLRHLPYALELSETLMADASPLAHYTGVRLMLNIAHKHPEEARRVGEREIALALPLTRQLATWLLEY